MAKLSYTSESKGFRYEEDDYTVTGNKVSRENTLVSIDGGTIQKGDAYVGSFCVRFDDGTPRVSINDVVLDEHDSVSAIVKTLLDALRQ